MINNLKIIIKKNILFMFRNEFNLLEQLFRSLENETFCNRYYNKKKEKNDVDIEKYRDDDDFINLTKVKDFNEVKNVINSVENKNKEEMKNKNNLESTVEQLANEFKDIFDTVNITVKTPEGEVRVKKTKEEQEPKVCNKVVTEPVKKFIGVVNGVEYDMVEDYNKAINEAVKNGHVNAYTKTEIKSVDECKEEEKTNEVVIEKSHADEPGECGDLGVVNTDVEESDDLGFEEEDFGEVVVLHNVGGEGRNYPFYNAVRYICEQEYFPNSGVYEDDDVYPEKVDVHVLLPNMFGKIITEAIEHFSERLADGEEVFVIDPETFELTEIKDESELWNDYSMTKAQEYYF